MRPIPNLGITSEMSILLLVSYDISGDRDRLAVSKILLGWGERVQKSVFECHVDCVRDIEAIQRKIQPHLDEATDTVRYYTLCEKDRADIITYGQYTFDDEPDYQIF